MQGKYSQVLQFTDFWQCVAQVFRDALRCAKDERERTNAFPLLNLHLCNKGPHHEDVEHLQVSFRLPPFQVADILPKAAHK